MCESKSYLMFTEQGHFGYSECTFQLEIENIPEHTIMYLNQSRITYKDSKKIYYAEYFVLGQILERSHSPKNLEDIVLGSEMLFLFVQDTILILVNLKASTKCLGKVIVRGDQK